MHIADFRIFKLLPAVCDAIIKEKGGSEMKRLTDLLIFALCILLALSPAVHANSGPTSWEGTTASGIQVDFEECPIQVEHETLTFDIPEFPLEYYSNAGEFRNYSASVTAEYALFNPTDADVTIRLLFPFGSVPQYAPDYKTLPEHYGVFADGEAVETVLRHSLSWGSYFDMTSDSALLRDDFTAHEFYAPDLTVTKYTYQPTGINWEDRRWIEAALHLPRDSETTRYLLEPNHFFQFDDALAQAGCSMEEDEAVTVICIGEDPGSDLPWTIYADGKLEEELDGVMECIGTEQLTLKEYLLSFRPANSSVSEIDWYNAYVDLLDRSEVSFGFLDSSSHSELSRRLMSWYEYSLTIPAGQRVTNTVTAPMYPDINLGWEPAIYAYGYLFSPAERWVIFGTLDVTINTPYHLTQCNLDGFEKTDSGYELHLMELPDKELEFVLSSVKHPNKPGTHAARTFWAFAGIAVLVVALLIRRRRRT